MAVNSFNAQNPPVTTKGDVFTFSTIPTRLGVGANNTVLTADSSTATGLKWATTSSGSLTLISSASLSTGTTTISSIPGTYKALLIFVYNLSTSGLAQPKLRFNSDSGNNYSVSGGNRTENADGAPAIGGLDIPASSTSNVFVTYVDFYAGTSHYKPFNIRGVFRNNSTNEWNGWLGAGAWVSNSAITSVNMVAGGANTFDGGTIEVYGVN